MATLTTTLTVQGRINGQSISITITGTVTGITTVLDRSAQLSYGTSMTSLNDLTPEPPNADNTEIAYIRFDTIGPSPEGRHYIDTVGAASEGRYLLGLGEFVELYRAEAGGVFAENNTATTSAMQVVQRIEQVTDWTTANLSLLVAFKPIS
jgi:hypothetical protein